MSPTRSRPSTGAGLTPGDRSETNDEDGPGRRRRRAGPARRFRGGSRKRGRLRRLERAAPPHPSARAARSTNDQVAGQLDAVASTIRAIRELDARRNALRRRLERRAARHPRGPGVARPRHRRPRGRGTRPQASRSAAERRRTSRTCSHRSTGRTPRSSTSRARAACRSATRSTAGPPQRAAAAREFGRATTDQAFGIDADPLRPERGRCRARGRRARAGGRDRGDARVDRRDPVRQRSLERPGPGRAGRRRRARVAAADRRAGVRAARTSMGVPSSTPAARTVAGTP